MRIAKVFRALIEASAAEREDISDTEQNWMRKKLEFIERQNRRQFFSTSTYLGDYTAETWITSGQRIFVDTRDLGIGQHLMFRGYWEATTTEVLKKLVSENSSILDLGAHYGYHTITMAQMAPKGSVVAVEANPRMYELVVKSVRVNQLRDQVRIHHCAVSETNSGTLEFVTPSDDPALGHIAGADDPADCERATVPVRCVDDLCRDVEKVDIIKIDVEGHEIQALRGARDLLSRSRAIVLMEYAPSHIERQQTTDEFHEELITIGFSHVYDTTKGKIVESRFDDLAKNRTLRNIVLSAERLSAK